MNIDNFYFMYNINALHSHNCSEATSEPCEVDIE